jgi:hypothetical protein
MCPEPRENLPRRSIFAVWRWPSWEIDERPVPEVRTITSIVLRGLAYSLLAVFFGYYVQSILSLPLADRVWLGEIPLFALIQLPKMKLKHFVQDAMIRQLPALGLASGSPSPDMILTHPWALGFTVLVPGLIFLCCLTPLLRFVRHPKMVFVTVIVVMCLDAGLTFWFDATSRLSIF